MSSTISISQKAFDAFMDICVRNGTDSSDAEQQLHAAFSISKRGRKPGTGSKSAKKPRRRASASKAGPKDRKRNKALSREYVEAILLAVALALFLRTFVVQAFRIPSGSMEDSLLVGDFLLANKFIYGAKIPLLDVRLPGIQDPKAGDVIIFQYPKDPDRDFIKRCVAGNTYCLLHWKIEKK